MPEPLTTADYFNLAVKAALRAQDLLEDPSRFASPRPLDYIALADTWARIAEASKEGSR